VYQGYKADEEGSIDPLIILICFDWLGNRTELKGYSTRIKQSCKKFNIPFLGSYGSMKAKWDYVSVFESNSFDEFLEMGRKVTRHSKMSHHMVEILLRQEI